MNRRSFIKVIGAGAVIAAATPVVVSQFGSQPVDVIRPSVKQNNILETLISYAMLCPNPHNTQAWKVAILSANTVRLFVDEERLLPQTDPFFRQIHIGQGCFIESMVIAASHFGLRAEVNYFPLGEYSELHLEALPVADIQFFEAEQPQADPMFNQLLTRQSTKTPYELTTLTQEQQAILLATVESSDFSLTLINEDGKRKTMAEYLIKAMEIEESKASRSLETIGMFRFNDEEIQQRRDGFGLAQNGVTGFKRSIAETFFVSREKAESDPAAFGKESVKIVQKAVANNPHYALLTSSDNSRLTQVKIGRLYNRINLLTASLGIAQHPMSQILQEYDDMLPLQNQFKSTFNVPTSSTVQMLFRLGVADATPASPRREVKDILV